MRLKSFVVSKLCLHVQCNPEGNVKMIVSRANLFEDSFQQVPFRHYESCSPSAFFPLAVYCIFLVKLSFLDCPRSIGTDLL